RTARRKLDKGAPIDRAAITRWCAPHRVGEAGELTLHPAELSSVLDRLFLGLGDVDLLQEAMIVRTAPEAGLSRRVVVDLPDLLRPLDRRVQRDVGIAVLRRPDDRLGADHARDPYPRVGLLQRYRPRVDDAVLVMSAFPAEWPLPRPRRDDQIVRLLETVAVEGWVDAGGELLLSATTYKAGDQAPFRDHVDHR